MTSMVERQLQDAVQAIAIAQSTVRGAGLELKMIRELARKGVEAKDPRHKMWFFTRIAIMFGIEVEDEGIEP